MQIGDQVRFLNEVGGGRITGFQGKDIVLIEDADGFDIPMLRSQVVVIETNANNFERKKKETEKPAPRFRYLDDNVDDDPSERPISYQPKPQERKGGELLNICLAFVPENSRELSNTRFEAYLINDSNYYVSAAFANNEGAAWHLRWQGTIEPNTKQYVETFDRSMLNDLERLSVQLIAWKQDKPFMLKPAVGVELRLDMVKFYKLHVFQPSPFFREPALIYDIVRDDRPIRQVFVEAEEVLDAMRGEYGNGDEMSARHITRLQRRKPSMKMSAQNAVMLRAHRAGWNARMSPILPYPITSRRLNPSVQQHPSYPSAHVRKSAKPLKPPSAHSKPSRKHCRHRRWHARLSNNVVNGLPTSRSATTWKWTCISKPYSTTSRVSRPACC